MRIVIALGGNALLQRNERPDAEVEQRHVRQAAVAIAPLAADHQLIVCHGNGPQIGILATESAADTALSRPFPLDVLGAQTQGMIGYWLAQELTNAGSSCSDRGCRHSHTGRRRRPGVWQADQVHRTRLPRGCRAPAS